MVNELYHHGIKGQRWGVRRYHNADGSLSNAGLKKYANLSKKQMALSSKLTRLDSKKTQLTESYKTVGHAKAEARTARLTERRNKLEPRVSRIERRALKGKQLGILGRYTLNKAYRLDRAIARTSKAKLRFDSKISKINAETLKIQKRIDKYDKKLNQLDPKHEAAGKIYVNSLKIDKKANGAEVTKDNLRTTAREILSDKSSTRSQTDWADYVIKNI